MKKLLMVILATAMACTAKEEKLLTAVPHEFPSPVDTRSREIEYQDKRVFEAGNVSVTNDFPSGRLNAKNLPENSGI